MNPNQNTLSRAYHSVIASSLLLDLYIEVYLRWDLEEIQKKEAEVLMRLLSRELDASREIIHQIVEEQ